MIRAEEETPGEPADAVVWEQLEQSAGEEPRLSITYLCFMIVATIIAGIGPCRSADPHRRRKVVGPEFGPLVALGIGIVTVAGSPPPRDRHPALGFAVGTAEPVISTWILPLQVSQRVHADSRTATTSFIWNPDALPWIVGFLADIAGMLALTSAKSGALAGVLISVT